MNTATIGLDVAKNVFQIRRIRLTKWPDPPGATDRVEK